MKTLALVLSLPVWLSMHAGLAAQEVKERATLRGDRLSWRPLALSPDGKTLAFAGGGKRGMEAKLWDIESGKEIASLGQPKPVQAPAFADDRTSIEALKFSPDGKRLAAADREGRIAVWEIPALTQVGAFQGEGLSSLHLAFSLDGKKLAAAGDRNVRLWDVASGSQLNSFHRVIRAHHMAFSHDLKTLASPNHEDMDLWDVATGKERRILADHRGDVGVAAFSADDKILVVSSWLTTQKRRALGQIKIWDVATGRERATVPGDFGWVIALALSPDGQTLALVDLAELDGDCVLKVLDLPTGKLLFKHQGVNRSFATLAFTSNAALFAAGGVGNDLKVWEILLPKKEP